jgi:hypothetical protein
MHLLSHFLPLPSVRDRAESREDTAEGFLSHAGTLLEETVGTALRLFTRPLSAIEEERQSHRPPCPPFWIRPKGLTKLSSGSTWHGKDLRHK